MTWYLDKPIYWISHPYIHWSLKEFAIRPPKHCSYTKNNTMYLPLLNFTKGIINKIKRLVITKNFDLKKF